MQEFKKLIIILKANQEKQCLYPKNESETLSAYN